MDLNDEQFQYLKDKYIKLFYRTYHKIYYKDKKMSSKEDYVQDFYCLLCMVCRHYSRKVHLPIDDFYKTDYFGQYLKTSMWNWRTSRGMKNEYYTKLHNATTLEPIVLEGSKDIETNYSAVEISQSFRDLELKGDVKQMVEEILTDPTYFRGPGDRINIKRLSRVLGKPIPQTKALYYEMKEKLSLLLDI